MQMLSLALALSPHRRALSNIALDYFELHSVPGLRCIVVLESICAVVVLVLSFFLWRSVICSHGVEQPSWPSALLSWTKACGVVVFLLGLLSSLSVLHIVLQDIGFDAGPVNPYVVLANMRVAISPACVGTSLLLIAVMEYHLASTVSVWLRRRKRKDRRAH